jgi:hypothetical protein
LPKESNTELARGNLNALEPFREVLASVPAVDEDPTPRMMAFILASDSAQQWEELFESQNLKSNAGRRVRIHAIRQAVSDYDSRLGIYLLCDVSWLDTGEQGVMGCSSEIGMAQLLNLHARNDLPHDLEIIEKDRPTKSGFKPMRFRSLGKVVSAPEAG